MLDARAARGVRRTHAGAALGRPAAARRARPRADHQPARAAARRAAVGARRVPAPADARRAAGACSASSASPSSTSPTPSSEAIALADLVVVMDQGRIEQAASARDDLRRAAAAPMSPASWAARTCCRGGSAARRTARSGSTCRTAAGSSFRPGDGAGRRLDPPHRDPPRPHPSCETQERDRRQRRQPGQRQGPGRRISRHLGQGHGRRRGT